ncbi:hypothetical protein [Pedobacter sp.]|uniref:hypothetical protein n=1 Tax=Pedobacter sp. TaxID=1411316 RepID=UPI003D7FBFE8
MRKYVFLLLVFLSSYAYAQLNDERVLYIIDNVPILETPDEEGSEIANEDIELLQVITDIEKIKALGYDSTFQKVIIITTKAFAKRPAAVKLIPSTKNMTRKNGQWFLKDADKPYTGQFIDYFMNGNIQGEGMLKDGLVNGVRTVYYPNGNKRYFYTYLNGVQNGDSEEYFKTGILKQKGSFKENKETGLWQVFYSTGKLKRQSNFVQNKQDLPREELKFYALLQKGKDLMKANENPSAVKRFDEANKIIAGYADLLFCRGTAKLNTFDFDNAIIDFDNAIEIEPLYMEAISNRAFARIRKYEFKDQRLLSKNKEVTILAVKDKVVIPKEDLDKICADLNLGYQLGDRVPMLLDAIKQYCPN